MGKDLKPIKSLAYTTRIYEPLETLAYNTRLYENMKNLSKLHVIA